MTDDSTARALSVPDGIASDADAYDEYTVGDVRDAVRDADMDASDLEALYRYEANQKQRTTVLDWLTERITDAGGTVPGGDAAADADAESGDAENAGGDGDGDAADTPAASPVTQTPDEGHSATQVTLRAPSTGYYGGEWFDSGGTKNVEWSPRLADAVRDGPLTVVAARDEDALPEDLRPSRDRRSGA